MQNNNRIFLDQVTLKAGQKIILRDTSLSFSLKGITLLTGENGVGKSTFLSACLGLVAVEKGKILINSEAPQKLRRRVGYMPQVLNNVALEIPAISHVKATLSGNKIGFSFSSFSKKRELERLLTITGSESFSKRPLGLLSGGERKRICLAQALANQPSILFLDEPLAALDKKAQFEIVDLLGSLAETTDLPIIMTSHEVEILEKKISRIFTLKNESINVIF